MPPSDGRGPGAAGVRVRLLEAELRVERRYAAQSDARVRELQSHLREALAESAESRETAQELQRALTTAEECRAVLEAETASRERELAALLNRHADPADGADPQIAALAETLAEHSRWLAEEREKYATALQKPRPESATSGILPAVEAERRLRLVEATLKQTLEELEQHQVAAIELRTVLVATEHRAAAVERDLGERARQAERKAEATHAELIRVREQAEESRIAAAEARTILDATEYRIPQLEEVASARQRECEELRQELGGARTELQAAHESAASLESELAQLRSGSQEAARMRAAEQNALQEARAALSAASQRAEQAEAERAQSLSEVKELTAALEQARDQTAAVAEERDAAGARASALEEALADRERSLAELREEQSADATRMGKERADLERRLADAEAAQREISESHGALREAAEKERETLVAATRGLERKLADAHEERDRLVGNSERLGLINAQLEERVRELAASHASASERLTTAEARGTALAGELDAERSAQAEALANVERLQAEGDAVRRTLGEVTGQLNELRAQLDEERRVANELRGLHETSTELYAQAEGDLQQAVAGRVAAESRAIDLGAVLAERERELGNLRQALAEAGESAEAQRARLAALEQEHAALQRAREDAARRLAACSDRDELASRAAAQAAELARAAEQTAQFQGVREELEGRQKELQDALRAQSDELRAAREGAHAAEMQAKETLSRLEEAERAASRADDERAETLRRLAEREEEIVAVRSAHEREQGRVTEVEAALAAAEARERVAEAAVADAQARVEAEEERRAEEAARAAAVAAELEAQAETRRTLENALSEERGQVARLEAEIEAAMTLAERETGTLQSRLAEAHAERDRLRKEVAGLIEIRDQLRVRAAVADDIDRQQAENARLAKRIEDLERQHAEAARQHSEAVSGYTLEVRQRTDELHQSELELANAREELQAVHQACEDAVGQLAEMKQEREALEEQIRELQPSQTADASPPSTPGGAELQLAVAPDADAAEQEPPPPSGPVTVVHVEDQTALCELVRSAVLGCEEVRYAPLAEIAGAPPERPFFVANLLVQGCEFLDLMEETERSGVAGSAFVYCVEGLRGIVIGQTEFFSPPFDAERCATRLLERPGGIRRVLAVGENTADMNEVRALLNRARCSTSVALDARQAYDLVPMVKPEAVLIDLGLPRGEGLRLAARLRTDPSTAEVGIAFLWGRPLDAEEFRLHAARAVRDCQFASEHLIRPLLEELNAPGVDSEELRVAG